MRKSDKTLWILDPIRSSQSSFDWGSDCIGNEKGEFIKPDYEDLTHLKNEFGEPVSGEPNLAKKKHPVHKKKYLLPDMSLTVYIDMPEEEKERRRQIKLSEIMKRFNEELEAAIAKPKDAIFGLIARVLWINYYNEKYLEPLIAERADHIFHIGNYLYKIYIFDGVPFARTQHHVFERIQKLNREDIRRLYYYLEDGQ